MLRIDCGEFVRQRSEEERKRERIRIRCRGCHGANEVAKKEGRKKKAEEAA